MTSMTFHLDLSWKPFPSEVGVNATEAQQVRFSARGEKIFKQKRALKRMLTGPAGLDPDHRASEGRARP